MLNMQGLSGSQNSKKPWNYLGLSLLLILIFYPVKYFSVFEMSHDYGVHIHEAQKWFESGEFFGAPHFIFQILVIAAKVLTGWEWLGAGLAVDLLFYVFLGFLLLRELAKSNSFSDGGEARRLAVSFGLMFCHILVWPLFILYLVDQKLYGGYIATNVFHNPTIVILKPLAVLIHLQICDFIVHRQWRLSGKASMGLFALVVVATLSKPNYTLVLLPALSLFLLLQPQLRIPRLWFQPIAFVLAPGFLVLLAQFLAHFISSSGHGHGTSVIFAPFAVFGAHSQYLVAKFFLSIAFPFTVILLFWRRAAHDIRLRFSWFAFGIGSFYTYFLAESGIGLVAGNFGWSSQITLFLLFFETSLFLLDKTRSDVFNARKKWSFGILLTHVCFGFIAAFNLEKILQ